MGWDVRSLCATLDDWVVFECMCLNIARRYVLAV
jgi:hypothetical protein